MQPAGQPQPPQNFTFSFGNAFNDSSKAAQPAQASGNNQVEPIEQPWVKTPYSDKDSDVQVRSADGTLFKLHRAVLEIGTGSFPGADVPTEGEEVSLTEDAKVLSILFSFIYPKRHPDLDDLDFQTVAAVAEAAGKYEVFAAMNTCNTRLGKFLPQHALDIFVHAVKHDHPKLMKRAIPHLCRAPLVPVISRLPPHYMLAWTKYHEAFTAAFKETAKYVKSLPPTANVLSTPCETGKGICNTCRCNVLILISDMEAIEDMELLNSTLRFPLSRHASHSCCGHGSTAPNKPRCLYVTEVVKLCDEKIRAIPPFEAFLTRKEQASRAV